MKTPRRLIDLIRGRAAPQSRLEDAGLYAALDAIGSSVEKAASSAEQIGASEARAASALEAEAERARQISERCEAASQALTTVLETLERLDVVQLNAGLEGARLGDESGRALGLLADELKRHLRPGLDAARTAASSFEQSMTQAHAAHTALEQAREGAKQSGRDAGQIRAQLVEAQRQRGVLEERLARATGLDPQAARALEAAAEHSGALMRALSGLSAEQLQRVGGSLRAALEPVELLLSRLPESEGSSEGSGS